MLAGSIRALKAHEICRQTDQRSFVVRSCRLGATAFKRVKIQDMQQAVYIETTIVSYLTARPSGDLITAAHQQITQEWWTRRRADFELFVSQFVIQEARMGDVEMAQKRLEELQALALLEVNEKVEDLAQALIADGALPAKAAIDALHIAVATVHGMDYLLTWNCKHIANAELQLKVAAVCRGRGFEPPIICTPEELLGE
jgi:PIN domain-containing protein